MNQQKQNKLEPCQRFANLSNNDLSYQDLQGYDLTGATLKGAKLIEANLSGAILKLADLTNADLQLADLTNASLEGANFKGANLNGAILLRAKIQETNFEDANLKLVETEPNVKLDEHEDEWDEFESKRSFILSVLYSLGLIWFIYFGYMLGYEVGQKEGLREQCVQANIECTSPQK